MEGTVVENKRIILKRYITVPPVEEDMEVQVSKITLRLDTENRDVLVKNLYLSCDPYMAHRMKGNKDSYIEPFNPGSAIVGFGVAKVILSNNPEFKENDVVTGMTTWEAYNVIQEGSGLRKISTVDIPLSYYLGILGLPGLTAYAGFFDVCSPKEGEHVFVSAASGAVGQLVGQFAKLMGCRVIGSAGTDGKVDLLKKRLGFDDAFNYKTEPDLTAALKRYFPGGIDIYFDNVGGKMLEAVLDNLKVHARIAVCGMISDLSNGGGGIHNLRQLIIKRAKMQGFLMHDYLHLQSEFTEKVIRYLKEGKVIYIEDTVEGLEKAPSALIGILNGNNVGKQVVRLQ